MPCTATNSAWAAFADSVVPSRLLGAKLIALTVVGDCAQWPRKKGSDVNLAVHLLNDAWAGRFDAAAVISNDTDPVRANPYLPAHPADRLRGPLRRWSKLHASAHIRQSHLAAAQFVNPVVCAGGTLTRCPLDW